MRAKSKTPVEITNMRTPIVITSCVTIELPYPGKDISKNYLFRGGDRRKGMTPEAKAWQETLVEWIQRFPFYHMREYIKTPVQLEVGARFTDERNRSDVQNFVELCSDAVQEAIGVDDKFFEVSTKMPEVGVEVPVVIVTLKIRMEV